MCKKSLRKIIAFNFHRLSKLAGAKLTDNNPAIADLSDPNRPTKLGEQYNELYDNQWTDAFDSLKTKLKMSDEVKIVQLLQQILFVSLKQKHWSGRQIRTIYVFWGNNLKSIEQISSKVDIGKGR